MIPHRYGRFEDMQFDDAVKYLQKKIFYLLLLVDKETAEEARYGRDIDPIKAVENVLYLIDGLNDVLFYPASAVRTVALLTAAKHELEKPEFDFETYRKLILDAGRTVMKLKEVRRAGA